MVKDLQQEQNRQTWGAGYGMLARWRTTVGATSYTLQRKYRGNTAGGDGFGSTFGGKYLEEIGSAVPVVITSASPIATATVATANIAVTAVAKAADGTYVTITCTNPSVVEAAGTFYVRPGNMVTYNASNNTGGARVEMVGLRGIVTDEDLDEINLFDGSNTSPTSDPLQGLDADTYAWWQAIVDKHSSGRYAGQRALTFDLMQGMFDKVEIKAGKDYGPDLILTTHALRREYLNLCRADHREVNTMQLDGGFSALDYNGVPFTVDKDAIDGEIYFLTTRDLQIYRMSDWEWMSMDGAVLARVSGYDAYEATIYRYAVIGCNRRNSQGVLCDLNYTAD